MTTAEKKELLRKQFDKYAEQDICVAFSGGVDSSLILIMACEAAAKTGKKVYAVTMDTVLHPKADVEAAKKVLEKTEAIHEILTMNELAVPEMHNNPKKRCYFCKKALYKKMLEFAAEKGVEILLEGSNEDDLHVYRPGLQAVRELGVLSPLAACGVTKEEVREMAKEYEIPTAGRPSAPCLATRLPYGTEIKTEALEKIACGEEYLKKQGFSVVRIRLHGEICRIELPKTDFGTFLEKSQEITETLQKIGFQYITLDVQGFRSGSMDEFRNKSCQEKILDR